MKKAQEKFGSLPRKIILNIKQTLGIDTDSLLQGPKFSRATTRNVESSFWENFEIVLTQLISHDFDLINCIQSVKPSILYRACAFGVLEMVQVLLKNVEVVEFSDLFRLECELSYWSSLITIISSGSLHEPKTLMTALLCQVDWSKYQEIITLLLKEGLDPNHQDNNESGSFALNIASSDGHSSLVKLLLTFGANVDQQDKQGVSSLMKACGEGHVEVCDEILRNQAKVDLYGIRKAGQH